VSVITHYQKAKGETSTKLSSYNIYEHKNCVRREPLAKKSCSKGGRCQDSP